MPSPLHASEESFVSRRQRVGRWTRSGSSRSAGGGAPPRTSDPADTSRSWRTSRSRR